MMSLEMECPWETFATMEARDAANTGSIDAAEHLYLYQVNSESLSLMD